MKRSRLVVGTVVGVLSCWPLVGMSQGAESAVLERDDVRTYITQLVNDHGFEQQQLEEVFATVKIQPEIIAKISKPAEKVWSWGRYKNHLVDEQRVADGVKFWREHRATLERAQQTFGVAPEIVLAILGIETRYGEITGSYPVVEALTTLGFGYPPRAKFFRKELTEALLLAREEQKSASELKGSYAGAMGYGQFIPSSYRFYAVDFDADGRRDIWANPVDAIGSIANYFSKHNWRGTRPAALQVDYQKVGDGIAFDTGINLDSTVAELERAGMRLSKTQRAAADGSAVAKLYRVQASDDETEYWLALHDFYVITRYNRSHLYALAVHHLATAIAARLQDTQS